MIDIEMLEGMANGEALAVGEDVGSVLLYTPVTKKSDFPSAVAYLVRRLDREHIARELSSRLVLDQTWESGIH